MLLKVRFTDKTVAKNINGQLMSLRHRVHVLLYLHLQEPPCNYQKAADCTKQFSVMIPDPRRLVAACLPVQVHLVPIVGNPCSAKNLVRIMILILGISNIARAKSDRSIMLQWPNWNISNLSWKMTHHLSIMAKSKLAYSQNGFSMFKIGLTMVTWAMSKEFASLVNTVLEKCTNTMNRRFANERKSTHHLSIL